MSDTLTGDPYHEGASLPMMHLQGSMGPVYTQEPDDQSTNYENDRPQSANDITPWNTTTLDSTGGDHSPVGSHDHNGYRTPPSQGPTSA